MDVVEIMKIKTSPRLLPDHLAWAPQKHRLFTVRSAYGLAMNESWRSLTQSNSLVHNGNREIWNLIWKGDAPPKI
jgi:hypothetical protein